MSTADEVLAPHVQVLAREVDRLEQDHLAALPDSKWPLLTVARLKEAQVGRLVGGCYCTALGACAEAQQQGLWPLLSWQGQATGVCYATAVCRGAPNM